MINLRVFMTDARGRHVPTRAGVCFPEEALGQLRQLVGRAQAVCGEVEAEPERATGLSLSDFVMGVLRQATEAVQRGRKGGRRNG